MLTKLVKPTCCEEEKSALLIQCAFQGLSAVLQRKKVQGGSSSGITSLWLIAIKVTHAQLY